MGEPMTDQTPQEVEDRKLAELIAEALRKGLGEDNAMRDVFIEEMLPHITAAFSRVREERDRNTRRWHLILMDLWAVVDPAVVPEELNKRVEDTLSSGCVQDCGSCEATIQARAERDALQREVGRAKGLLEQWYRKGLSPQLLINTWALLAPEPQKAKEEPMEKCPAVAVNGWRCKKAKHSVQTFHEFVPPAPPPPEEPGRPSVPYICPSHWKALRPGVCAFCAPPLPERHAFVAGTYAERVGGTWETCCAVVSCGKPASDPVHTPAPQRLLVEKPRGAFKDALHNLPPQPERPAEQWKCSNPNCTGHPASEHGDALACSNRGEGERAEERPYTPAELVAVRERMGLTQEQLSEKLKVSRGLLAQWETGITRISFRTTLALVHLSKCAQPDSRDALLEDCAEMLDRLLSTEARYPLKYEAAELLSRLNARKG